MKIRKSFAVLIALVMLVAVTAGCSNAEWGLYNLSKETSSLEKYQTTGEIGLTLDYINPEILGYYGEEVSQIQKVLNNYSLTFDAQIDTKASKLAFTFYIKDKSSGNQQEILNLLSDGNTVYAKVDELFKFVKSFGNAELNATIDQLFADVQYVSISKEEMKSLLTQAYGGNEALAQQISDVYFNLGSYTDQYKGWENTYETFMKDVYDDYEMGIVKEDNNKYTISMSVEDIVNVFASFANYSIDNIDEVGSHLKDSIGNLSATQKQLLGLEGIDLSDVNSSIDLMVADVSANKDEYKANVNSMVSNVQDPDFKKTWEGTKFDYSFEKTSEGVYVSDFEGVLDLKDPTTNTKMFKASMTIKENIKAMDSIDIVAPTGNILSVTQLMGIISSVEQSYSQAGSVGLQVDLDNGNYITSDYEEGTVNVKVIDGSSYLALKQVGTLLGKDIKWDNEKKQPYVESNGAKTYLDAAVIDGVSYIPSRAFEKIGYKVSWDSETNVVTIQ